MSVNIYHTAWRHMSVCARLFNLFISHLVILSCLISRLLVWSVIEPTDLLLDSYVLLGCWFSYLISLFRRLLFPLVVYLFIWLLSYKAGKCLNPHYYFLILNFLALCLLLELEFKLQVLCYDFDILI